MNYIDIKFYIQTNAGVSIQTKFPNVPLIISFYNLQAAKDSEFIEEISDCSKIKKLAWLWEAAGLGEKIVQEFLL